MLAATHKPFNHARPSISYPIPLSDYPPTLHSPLHSPTQTTQRSMSIKSHRGRRPSLSSPMSWLTRSNSSGSQNHPARASHAKSSSIGSITHSSLGVGVTIVRTPQEALAGTGVTLEYPSDPENENGRVLENSPLEEEEEEGEGEGEEGDMNSEPADQADSHAEQSETPSVPPAYSPPRSSLPLSKSTPSLPLKDPQPGRPTRPPPLQPVSDIQKKLPPPPLSSLFPPVPPLLHNLPNPSSPPPFECVLLSPAPPSAIDFSKVLVTLETCTATHRTTFSTLTSRPSRLANYLKSLFANGDEELDHENGSLSPHAEERSFNSIFHNHLTSSGLLSPSAYNVHIFLDRASPSYDHILAYLRSQPTTIEHLHSATPARLEALLALRDEAAYLDLPELVHLCTAEMRRNPCLHLPQLLRNSSSHVLAHTRGPSSSTMRSMDTLRERDENDAGADADVGSTSTGRDSIDSAKSAGSARGRGRSRSTTTAPVAAAANEKKGDPSPHPATTPLLHRRITSQSQSRERPELMEVKSATLRGRPAGNWL
ncbi:hypothetical protein F5148DRAFT_1191572 [Russula earlei]|uniref:Uncharacterized protein n=1 Tax=Russula earlei TaxID=71964 RepID=A0ACC0UBT1_9AGAM|nr:hypothetical protein F5148DRAFT_1191572 [Russula earlei]